MLLDMPAVQLNLHSALMTAAAGFAMLLKLCPFSRPS